MAAQTVTDLFGAGASLSNGVLTIDFTNVGRSDGVNTPTAITAAQAAKAILARFATLTAANDVSDAAIAAPTTPSTPQYISSRGGVPVSQMREAITVYAFFQTTNPVSDPDNLI